MFGIGPAGTGKTYLAMAKAVQALQTKMVNRIILTRPAVEAGERLGYLPGTLYEKIDPYLRPLYDALHDMLDPESIPKLMAAGTIEVAPLAYMRGRTLNDAFIILDEAQNTTPEQMKMFLTRLGFGSKIVVTGDVTQVDLPTGVRSGLHVVREILSDVDDVHFAQLSSADVVRHRLVADIVDAYARWDAAEERPNLRSAAPRNGPPRTAGPAGGSSPSRGRLRKSHDDTSAPRSPGPFPSRSGIAPASTLGGVSIEVSNESGVPVDAELIVSVARHALQAMRVSPRPSCRSSPSPPTPWPSCTNAGWTSRAPPTSCRSRWTSWSRSPGGPTRPTMGPALLGDIVLCPEFAKAQARSAGHSLDDELHLLTVHGVLHLLGYDHAEPDEEREMFALQATLLADWRRSRSAAAARAAQRRSDSAVLGTVGLDDT